MKICLCFSLFFSYPLMLIPLAASLERTQVMSSHHPLLPRAALVAVTVCLILSLPDFADLLEVVGATACSMVALVMPALCHLGCTWRDRVTGRTVRLSLWMLDLKKSLLFQDVGTWSRSVDAILISLGAAAMFMGLGDLVTKLTSP